MVGWVAEVAAGAVDEEAVAEAEEAAAAEEKVAEAEVMAAEEKVAEAEVMGTATAALKAQEAGEERAVGARARAEGARHRELPTETSKEGALVKEVAACWSWPHSQRFRQRFRQRLMRRRAAAAPQALQCLRPR